MREKPIRKPILGAEVEVERTDGHRRVGRVRRLNHKGIALDVSAEGGEHPNAFVTWELCESMRRTNVEPEPPQEDEGSRTITADELHELLQRVREEGRRQGRSGAVDSEYKARDERAAKKRASQTEEFDKEIISMLWRFEEVTERQLRHRYPILQYQLDHGRLLAEAAEFYGSPEAALKRLEAMEEEGLIASSLYSRWGRETTYVATERGANLAGLNPRQGRTPAVARERGYHMQMVDVYQRIMSTLREDAVWVTNRELLDDDVRTRRENELGRRLPTVTPSPSPQWPATPEGLLVLKESDAAVAVGLELTMVADKRMIAYEAILDRYSEDPSIDRAHLYFAHEEPMRRVEQLALRRRQDGFFVFEAYRTGKP